MKKIILIFILFMFLNGCAANKSVFSNSNMELDLEQKNNYTNQIKEFLTSKSWDFEHNISFASINIPIGVEGTYYQDIIKKSKDSGLELSKYLGKDAVEGVVTIKYPNGDVGGSAHFIFYDNKIIGGYYLSYDYIYSLNEKEVFKKQIKWENIENEKLSYKFEQVPMEKNNNFIYSGRFNEVQTYIFTYENDSLKMNYLDEGRLIQKNNIDLDGLSLADMFFKDVDNDNIAELGILVTNSIKGLSKLLVYDIEDGLKEKCSFNFGKPMLGIDYDGQNIIASSNNSVEMFVMEKEKVIKVYSNTKLGGKVKIDNIDGSNQQKYILVDSTGRDLYVFEKDRNGLREIWRTYNDDIHYKQNIQTGDLNHDGIKEIYIEDTDGNTRKIILGQSGFIETEEIIKGHKYFIGDFNTDNNFEYFDTFAVQKSKEYCTIYNY